MTLYAHHQVQYIEGEFEPVTLPSIGEKPQVVDSKLGGYTIHWTYYLKDGICTWRGIVMIRISGDESDLYALKG